MLFWDADQFGGDVERAYARWESRQTEWRNRMELGERVASVFEQQRASVRR